MLKTTLYATHVSAVTDQSLAIACDVPDAAPCGALVSDVPVQGAHEDQITHGAQGAPASEVFMEHVVAPSGNIGARNRNADIVQQNAPHVRDLGSHSCRVPCHGTRNCDRIEMSLILNGNLQANFEFDTGAGACIMPKAWLTLFTPEHRPVLQPCNVKLNLANGQLANITGSVHIDVITSA